MQLSRDHVAFATLVLSTLFWGSNVVVGRAIHEDVPGFAMAFSRNFLALFLILPLAWHTRPKGPGELRAQLYANRWTLLIAGSIGTGLFNAVVYNALHTTTATNAALMMSLCPAIVPVIAFFVVGERLRALQAFGIGLSILGVAAIVSRGDLASLLALDLVPGDLLMLIATGCWSLYTVMVRRKDAALSPFVFFAAILAIAVVTLLPFFVWETVNTAQTITARGWLAIAYVASFPTALAVVLFNRAVGIIGANRTGVFQHLVPVFATIFAILFLGERLALYHLVGAALIAAGVATATLKAFDPSRPPRGLPLREPGA